jgi:hypothetical protein
MHQPSQPGVFCTKMSLKLFQEIASRLLSMIKNFIVLFFALHENVANAMVITFELDGKKY